MIKVGDLVNGYTVLAVAARRLDIREAVEERMGLVILAQRMPQWIDEGTPGGYVTAPMTIHENDHWWHGNYFPADRGCDAWADFVARVIPPVAPAPVVTEIGGSGENGRGIVST